MQASRASSLMADLKRIVPDVELAMGPLLKVENLGGVVRAAPFGAWQDFGESCVCYHR